MQNKSNVIFGGTSALRYLHSFIIKRACGVQKGRDRPESMVYLIVKNGKRRRLFVNKVKFQRKL